MNTIITEKTDNGEVSYDIISKLVESRILFLYGVVDEHMSSDIAATLIYLDTISDVEPISLYLNLEAADIRSIFTIYDIMKLISSPIKTYCLGEVSHEAALLLAAGNKGSRYATANSTICLAQLEHLGSHVSDIVNAEVRFEQSKKDNDKFMSALAFECGKNVKTLTKDLANERYFSVKEAKEYGIIDYVIGEPEKKNAKNTKKTTKA